MKTDIHESEPLRIGGFTASCGIAANLIPLLDALGWRGVNSDLAEAVSVHSDEMNIEDLLKTMANLRFEGRVFKRMPVSSVERSMPCLCISGDDVYTLVTRGQEGGFYAYDGKACDYIKLERIPRRRTVITFRPLEESRYSYLKPQKKWFSQILQRFRREFTYGGVLSLLITVFSLATPFFVMLMISQMQTADRPETLFYLGAAIGIFIIAVNGIKGLRTALFNQLAERLGNIISIEVFRRLLYLSPQYTEVASVQQQTNRIRDFETIRSFFSGPALSSLIDAPMSLLLLAGLAYISGPLVIIPVSAILLFISLSLYYYRAYRVVSEQNSVSKSVKAALTDEMLENLSEIRKSGHSREWFERYSEVSSEAVGRSAEESAYLSRINISARTISSVTLVATVGFAAIRVMDGDMTGGALFASFLLVSRLLSPIGNGFSAFSQISKLQKSVRQLNKLMSLSIEVRPETIISLNKQMDGNIHFRNVFLKYVKESAPVLMNLSFRVKRHEMLAITGHDGGGKSSILKLLLGMYNPLSGSILIDEMNLKQIDVIRLRKSVSYIPSSGYIFSGTIRSNLHLARADASDVLLWNVLDKSGIGDIVGGLENGLDTDISRLPASLNQAWFFKLLHFSQAVLRDAPICLIDELEIGLNREYLERLIPVIKEMKNRATIIMVTSDPGLIGISDSIMQLDNGRILKYGTVEDAGAELVNGGES